MVIESFFKYFSKLPGWGGALPQIYEITFSLDRLVPGRDNLHYDVHLSPKFCKAISEIVLQFLVKHSNAEELLEKHTVSHWVKERDEFKRLCRELLLAAVDKAKAEGNDVQIDYLAQASIVKLLMKEVRVQFGTLMEILNSSIWEKEIALTQDLKVIAQFKEKTAGIRQSRKAIIYNASRELFQYLYEVQHHDINEIRKTHFGDKAILPNEFFANPILCQGNRLEDSSDDFLMIEEYVLLGSRSEDANTYGSILSLITELLGKIEIEPLPTEGPSEQKGKDSSQDRDWLEGDDQKEHNRERDGWIKHIDTIDTLFNYFQTNDQYKELKKNKGSSKNDLQDLKKRIDEQKNFLNLCYKKFNEKGLIEKVVACFEMQPIYLQYCPPLSPQQVFQFLVTPKTRQDIETHLKRIKRFYGKSISLALLHKVIKNMDEMTTDKKKEYLIAFMKDFARYHRDLGNYNILRKAMEKVNLITDKKNLKQSRANNTLHEFVFPEEQVLILDKRPIANHVIIKVDLRGSMDIVQHLLEMGHNPTSYFSQNFFDPISEVIYEYGASKQSIEGNAILLSMVERRQARNKSFNVARACGLAIKMLNIIRRYNVKNTENQLPVLEIGIGISFQNDPPIFLYDGKKRIMISSAVISAGRLSQCTRSFRGLLDGRKKPFNYYLCRSTLKKNNAAVEEEQLLRYNANGIALSASGYDKLSEEIDLKILDYSIPDFFNEKYILYTGKFPAVAGKYYRLVIREARIPEVDPENLDIIQLTEQKYYEICTNPALYEFVRNMG